MNLRTAFIRIAHENPETRSTLLPLVKQADKWESMPKGWTDESRKQFWETLTGDVKHKVTKCIKEMEGKFDDPGAFCASLADRVDPGWRSRQANLGDKPMSDRDLRSLVIRLAHVKPELRPALLPLLKSAADNEETAWEYDPGWRSRTAMEHSSPEALKNYLKEHPNADPKNHTVKKAPEKDEKAETSGGEGWKSDPGVQKASKEREKAERELKQFDESFPNMKAELDKLTPKFEELRDKAHVRGYIGSDSGELSKNDIKQLKESPFSPEEDDLVSDYLYLKNEVAKGPPSKGERVLYVERLEKATREEEEAIEAYEEEAANASYEKAMAKAKKPEAKKPEPEKKKTPAEIKEKAEEFAKNIKDPEERKKAITRLKKMSPAEMQAMVSSAGNTDEEAKGKQAYLRSKVIRLAHTRPELRADLLPLLK